MYIKAQHEEAKTREDRQIAVADSIEGQRQIFRAGITEIAMARLQHYNNCDEIRKERGDLKALNDRRQEFRNRIKEIERLTKATEILLEKIQKVIANDEFLFEPQRVKQLHYRKRAEFVQQLNDFEQEVAAKEAAIHDWSAEILRLERKHDAYFDSIRDNPPSGARMLTRYSAM